MGFPTSLNQWLAGEASDFVKDILSTSKAQYRDLINNDVVLNGMNSEGEYSRKLWGYFVWRSDK